MKTTRLTGGLQSVLLVASLAGCTGDEVPDDEDVRQPGIAFEEVHESVYHELETGVHVVKGDIAIESADNDVLGRIDHWFERGEIDARTRHIYRLAAVRNQALLPVELRGSLPRSMELGDGTRIAMEAFRWAWENGELDGELMELFQPPTTDYYLTSTELPLRVGYYGVNEEDRARVVLSLAETAWRSEHEEYGFYQPLVLPSAGWFDLVLADGDDDNADAYTIPFSENGDNPWSDCFCFINICKGVTDESMPWVVAHEMNHAMQAAMDCYESYPFWEMTATYIMSQVFPDSWPVTAAVVPSFQRLPWKSLGWFAVESGNLDERCYPYGGSLFAMYLAGITDTSGPVLLRQVWEASMQEASRTAGMPVDYLKYNEPDYLDAAVEVLARMGIRTDIDTLFMDFSESRFFVGTRNDGSHVSWPGDLTGGELSLAGDYRFSELPIDHEPNSDKAPAPLGANHLLVALPSGRDIQLSIQFDGDPVTRWGLRAVLFGGAETRSIAIDPAATNARPTILMTEGAANLLLVIGNLGATGYDVDQVPVSTSSYRCTIAEVSAPAVITAIEPAAIVRGTTDAPVRIVGSGFREGPRFSLTFNDPDLKIDSIVEVATNAIHLTFTVAATAKLGPRTVFLVNGDSTSAVGTDLLEIIDEESAGGWGCAVGAGRAIERGEDRQTDTTGMVILALTMLVLVVSLARLYQIGAADAAASRRWRRLGPGMTYATWRGNARGEAGRTDPAACESAWVTTGRRAEDAAS
ncbi:MAG: hypothetical protein V2A73_04070 [Pseudomonadota bacterium]